SKTMKTSWYLIWIFILTLMITRQEVLYIKGSEGQSVDLSCTPEQTGGAPVSLYLTHRCVRPEREVLFMAKDRSPGTVRVNRLYKDRLKVTGGLNSDLLNVTIAHLQRTDTGLYICEFVYTADPSDRTVSGSLEYFLFVEGTESVCQCSSYPPLIYTISAAAGLLLLVLICLCAVECVSSLINPNLTTIPQPSMLMSKFKGSPHCYSRELLQFIFQTHDEHCFHI
uniref:Immunoglobulin V-set domain-containing protein n=1 Tax=Oncorhynchus kisutch TaxID=8019 RepID=A0A8C7K352_ONCKI